MSKYDKVINYTNEEINPLTEGENLIWKSKPKKSAYLINQMLIMFPIAIIWLLFDSSFIIATISSGEIKEMLFFIIPFFALHLMPVWIWLGNVLTANKKWKNTIYYITDKRIIIQNGFLGENYQTIYYKDIKNIRLRIGIIDKMLNVGDIYFDLDFTSSNSTNSQTAFLDIENSKEIYPKLQKMVMDIQTDIEYPNAYRPSNNPGYQTKYNGKI